ncbi:hypothetical protein K491DRAFT_740444, partial [Lophiostoma macrostomum CBS 122681]
RWEGIGKDGGEWRGIHGRQGFLFTRSVLNRSIQYNTTRSHRYIRAALQRYTYTLSTGNKDMAISSTPTLKSTTTTSTQNQSPLVATGSHDLIRTSMEQNASAIFDNYPSIAEKELRLITKTERHPLTGEEAENVPTGHELNGGIVADEQPEELPKSTANHPLPEDEMMAPDLLTNEDKSLEKLSMSTRLKPLTEDQLNASGHTLTDEELGELFADNADQRYRAAMWKWA